MTKVENINDRIDVAVSNLQHALESDSPNYKSLILQATRVILDECIDSVDNWKKKPKVKVYNIVTGEVTEEDYPF